VTKIHLVRHGETDWNRELRWQGQSDVPLNARGREQARALAASLTNVPLAAIYSSDLRRAAETAEIVAEQLQLPLRVDAALREIDVGSWQGLTLTQLRVRVPEAVARWEQTGERGWEEGESHDDMFRRVVDAIRSIVDRHSDEEVLVVSHGGPIGALKALAAGLDYPRERRLLPRSDNCEACVIAVEDGAVRRMD
jgi:2,3-bisphosphoglycerate-dependent phosphoglycerate mutase